MCFFCWNCDFYVFVRIENVRPVPVRSNHSFVDRIIVHIRRCADWTITIVCTIQPLNRHARDSVHAKVVEFSQYFPGNLFLQRIFSHVQMSTHMNVSHKSWAQLAIVCWTGSLSLWPIQRSKNVEHLNQKVTLSMHFSIVLLYFWAVRPKVRPYSGIDDIVSFLFQNWSIVHYPAACKMEAKWMFGHLDLNNDGLLTNSELYDLEHDQNERCIKPFIDTCDLDTNSVLTPREWCRCFEKTDRPCAAIRRRLKTNPFGELNFHVFLFFGDQWARLKFNRVLYFISIFPDRLRWLYSWLWYPRLLPTNAVPHQNGHLLVCW